MTTPQELTKIKRIQELSDDIKDFITNYMTDKIQYRELDWILEARVIKNCKLD